MAQLLCTFVEPYSWQKIGHQYNYEAYLGEKVPRMFMQVTKYFPAVSKSCGIVPVSSFANGKVRRRSERFALLHRQSSVSPSALLCAQPSPAEGVI